MSGFDGPDLTLFVQSLPRALAKCEPHDHAPLGNMKIRTIGGAIHPCEWPGGPYDDAEHRPRQREWHSAVGVTAFESRCISGRPA